MVHEMQNLSFWAKQLKRLRNEAYPVHLESLPIIMVLETALYFNATKIPLSLVSTLVELMPNSFPWQIIACCISGLVHWILICLIARYTLKLLLSYRGFMFETRGKKISLKTKIWATLMKFIVTYNKPSLYSFQKTLPRLPLPSVEDTMKRYLRSIRPLLDDESYEEERRQANEFQKGIGSKLQRYLILKSWWSANYVSDWWEEYVYLRGRSSLMVNSNVYGTDCPSAGTSSQIARAANVIYLMLQFGKQIENQELEPIMAQGFVPLCSWQYKRMFNTARIPGIEGDKIVHHEFSNHVVILYKGCYYKMIISEGGRSFNACELQHQLEEIVKLNETATTAENHLAALTAWDRTNWAKVRNEYFSEADNKSSLDVIESAALFISLDDEPYIYNLKSSPTEYGYYGRQLMHGTGCNRWFDKSFQLCMGKNGKCGINIEHSWADAPVLSQLCDDCHVDDPECYDESGNIKGKIDIVPPSPTRLKWNFNESLIEKIEEAFDDSQKIINDLDLQLLVHDAFGKGFMKTCRLSPDGYIQMALQLAYFREHGKFTLTYEASMTRLYLHGRTETVRSCTIESSAWVKAMEDPTSNSVERVRLLHEACNQHQKGYVEAMCGQGIDRHLFSLYVVSKYLNIKSSFLEKILSEPWKLSTSQTPRGQTPKTAPKSENPDFCGAQGGFGPVARDGYGVSYAIVGENLLYFHVSSWKSSKATDTDRFVKRIITALNDIKLLFEDFKKINN